ncbi:MAG: hypothetical protein JNM17_38060 [Archangium sp.]|nr:hypothetical protein [Archangium sp.]
MPLDGRVQLFLATLAIDVGDLEGARTALENVLVTDPDSEESIEARAILKRLARSVQVGRQQPRNELVPAL